MIDLRSAVGSFDWSACESCKHANHADGGCLIMDQVDLGNVLNFVIEDDWIYCRKWEPEGD